MLALFEQFSEPKVLSIIQAFKWHFSRKIFFRKQKNMSNFSCKNIFQRKQRQPRNSKCEDWGIVPGVKLNNVMNLLKLLLWYVYYFGSDSTLLNVTINKKSLCMTSILVGKMEH